MSKFHIKFILIVLSFVKLQYIHSQCSGCTTTYTNNSVANVTVSAGQVLCIASGFSYTGAITLNGGTVCNDGTISKILFKKGTFNNSTTGKVSATSKSNLSFSLSGNLVLNNSTGALFSINDSLRITGGSTDTLKINNHEGASFNSGNLVFFSGCGVIKIGLAATTSTLSSFVTLLNINGDAVFNSGSQLIKIEESGTINITGKLLFRNTGIKTLTCYGTTSINDSLIIKGNGSGTSTITVNNYGNFSVQNVFHVSIINCAVSINNYTAMASSTMFLGQLDMNVANAQLINKDVLQVGGAINSQYGTFDNQFYATATSLNVDYATVTNSSIMNLMGNVNINLSDGTLNNNGKMSAGNFENTGKINLAANSVIICDNFSNYATGTVTGAYTAAQPDYAGIYIKFNSLNAGKLLGYINFIDKSKVGGKSIDNTPPGNYADGTVNYVHQCNFVPGYIFAGTNQYVRNRTKFCVGENVTLTYVPYMNVISPSWTFGTGGYAPITTGNVVTIMGITSAGNVTVSGTYTNGVSSCVASVVYSVSVIGGSMSATSPLTFGHGNPLSLTSTITVGTAPFSYTWAPNYFFTSPSNYSSANPTVTPQVSLIYTVSERDAYGCTASATVEVIGQPFASMDKELNGEYYSLHGNLLFFRHEAQYEKGTFRYFVYDKSHTVVASSVGTNIVNQAIMLSGDNRFTLNASTLSTGYYVLEAVNEKNEKTYLRFKK